MLILYLDNITAFEKVIWNIFLKQKEKSPTFTIIEKKKTKKTTITSNIESNPRKKRSVTKYLNSSKSVYRQYYSNLKLIEKYTKLIKLCLQSQVLQKLKRLKTKDTIYIYIHMFDFKLIKCTKQINLKTAFVRQIWRKKLSIKARFILKTTNKFIAV